MTVYGSILVALTFAAFGFIFLFSDMISFSVDTSAVISLFGSNSSECILERIERKKTIKFQEKKKQKKMITTAHLKA